MATNSVRRVAWQFWTALAAVFTVEFIACLIGFRILALPALPDPRLPFAVVWTCAFGWRLEVWMRTRGVPPASDKEYLALLARGIFLGPIYLIPVAAAVAGRSIPWLLAVSMVMFLGLMVRVVWLYARRPAEGAFG